MPVAEQVRVNTHTGNGSTTNFAYGYRIFEDADLTVTVDGVIQTLTTDYTVNGADDAGGGTIDFITAPINLSVVTLSGELTYERDTDFIQNGGMRADTFDNDFDYAIMLIQQNRRDITRSIKVPIEETTDQEVSTTAANRANKILAFDASGLPVAESLTDLSVILTTVDTSLALSGGILSVVIPNRQAVAAGTVDAITATFVPVIAALANNIEVIVEAAGANATITPTFAPDGLTAKTIVKGSDTVLVIGDIPGANFRMHLVFDSSLDKWILLNPASIVDLKTAQAIAGAKTFSDTLKVSKNIIFTKGADIASAAALPLDSSGNLRDITGTAAVTSMDSVGVGSVYILHFNEVLVLTHHATDLILPGEANIRTEAGDEFTFVEYATGDWRCIAVSLISGRSPLALSLQTEILTTSGTEINIPNIPSWVKRITIMFAGVSTNGTSDLKLLIGDAGGLEESGYLGNFFSIQNASGGNFGTSFQLTSGNTAGGSVHGSIVLNLEDAINHSWVFKSSLAFSAAARIILGAGSKDLSDTLTQIRLTTVNGTDEFDAGAINVMWE